MKDSLGREIEYMRISITDRCNMRCAYCMPEGCEKVPMADILTYEEIVEICRVAVELGITKFKITGGEPLVRPGCTDLIAMMREIPEIEHITITTNGALLPEKLPDLLRSGVDGINISLDSLKPERFREITGGGKLKDVMAGLDAAIDASQRRNGKPVIKTNSLIQRGINDDEIYDLAELAFDRGISVRFIETMPIGYGKAGVRVSNDEILKALQERYPDLKEERMVDNDANQGNAYGADRKSGGDNSLDGRPYTGNGPAIYHSIPGREGRIGFISPINHIFCQNCNRVRLTSQGLLKPCLCYDSGVDLKPILRDEKDATPERYGTASEGPNYDMAADHKPDLLAAISMAISQKPGGHSFSNPEDITEEALMSQIGG